MKKEQTAIAVAGSLGGTAAGGASGAAVGGLCGGSDASSTAKSSAIGAGVGALAGTAIAAGIFASMMDRPKNAVEYTVELDSGDLKVIAQTGKNIMKVGDRCLVVTSKKKDERRKVKSRVVPFTEPTKNNLCKM